MTNLKSIQLKSVYRSGKDNLLKDFYIPALKTAKYYDRAVGFFSTSLISYALKGISSIIENEGKMRLIIGHPLDEDEFEALKEGDNLKAISLALSKELDEIIEGASLKVEQARLKLFTMLVATNKLEVKFAFKPKGMYHEKIGIIKDANNDKILFHGSANETTNAISPDLNFESIAIYKSWNKEIYEEYATDFEVGFEELWTGNDSYIHTVDMPSELYLKIVQLYKKDIDVGFSNDFDELALIDELSIQRESHYPKIPEYIKKHKFKIFDHQQEALKQWFANEGKGLFRLATGSGKTITAMYGLTTIFNKASIPRKMLAIVAVPYQALAEQWVEELALFNMKPIRCFDSINSWETKLSDTINLLQNGNIEFASIVVVNRTLMGPRFQSLISRINENSIFFIGDECHRHATENMVKNLPSARYRMGLSATPYIEDNDFEFDDPNIEKELLTQYYGNVIANYTLAQALANGILTPYIYRLIPVHLTTDESVTYQELTKEIGRLISIDNSSQNASLSNAIRKRNKLIQNAENKKLVLASLLQKENIEDKLHTLFYVGEGSTIESEEDSETVSQLNSLASVISKEGWKLSKFTSLENKKDRRSIMSSFVEGDIDALVSMRVLDEGIDIPQCSRAFILASSSNSRQFIQRRGRILRRYEGKDVAEIFDFVVLPASGESAECFRKLVYKELKRVMDFVRLAQNRLVVEKEARNIAGLFDIEVEEV